MYYYTIQKQRKAKVTLDLLSTSLKRRYEEKYMTERLALFGLEIKNTDPKSEKLDKITNYNFVGWVDHKDYSITHENLYSLINDHHFLNSTTFIVLDTRPTYVRLSIFILKISVELSGLPKLEDPFSTFY